MIKRGNNTMPNQNESALVPRRTWLALIVGIFAATCLPGLVGSEEVTPAQSPRSAAPANAPAAEWSTLLTPEQLRERSEDDNSLLTIDVHGAAVEKAPAPFTPSEQK
jgi:hypothetical protein